jgi:transposase
MDYYSMIRSKNHTYDLRLSLVIHARQHGNRDAARAFNTDVKTVRLWRRRFEHEGNEGLQSRSRAPKTCPHKTSKATEKKIIQLRQQTHFSARRLKDEFAINASVGAIQRVLKQNQLTRKQRRKPHRNTNDHRAEKLAQSPLTHLQMDTKDLIDLALYKPLIAQGLPRYQLTIRDECTGATYLSFATEATVHYAALTATRLIKHFAANGVDPASILIRTDNGSEFSGGRLDHSQRGFVHTIETELGADHIYNPPSCPNANPDVESIHNTIEHEFYDLEKLVSVDDFLAKITLYQTYYNTARLNYSKGKRSPLDILEEKLEESPQLKLSLNVLLLQPVIYGIMPTGRPPPRQVGEDVPALVGRPLRAGGGNSTSAQRPTWSAWRGGDRICPRLSVLVRVPAATDAAIGGQGKLSPCLRLHRWLVFAWRFC